MGCGSNMEYYQPRFHTLLPPDGPDLHPSLGHHPGNAFSGLLYNGDLCKEYNISGVDQLFLGTVIFVRQEPSNALSLIKLSNI